MNEGEELVNNSYFQGDVFPGCFAHNPIATPTVMVKRSAIFSPPRRFPTNIRFGEDALLWCQLASDYQLGAIQESFSRVRIHGNNASLSARDQLSARANFYPLVKDPTYWGRDLVKYRYLILLFQLSYLANWLIENVFGVTGRGKILKLAAIVLYAPLYIQFKLYAFCNQRRSNQSQK